MTIPEAQLETWSHLGAVTTSRDTYATVKRALESSTAAYATKQFRVFLQGSYGNDTNIYSESDVDIVISYAGAFFHDLGQLPSDQLTLFKAKFPDGTYLYSTFKAEVQSALVAAFGDSVQPPNKAFKIAASGARRSADVVPAFQYRRFTDFSGFQNGSYFEGISFFTADSIQIDNFPDHHSRNLTAKHQATANRYKPAIRIFKNIRSKLIERGLLLKGEAPSYYIEGLLYNVPNELFAGTLNNMVLHILRWLYRTTDRSNFVCANERYYLLRDSSPVCWPTANGTKFINAAVSLWNDWSPRIRFI
jgi:hypothetical protein